MAPEWLSSARLVLGAVSTIVYILVGVVIGRRRAPSPDAVFSIRAFQVFWFGLAVITLFGPLFLVLERFDLGGLGLRVFILQAALILIVLAISGLLYYLAYVYIGRNWIAWPVAVYAFLEIAWLVTLVTLAHPIDYGPTCPNSGFCYENDFSGGSASLALSLSIVTPILLGAFGYFSLYFAASEKVQKRRIAMVAGSLLFWWGLSLFASLFRGRFETSEGGVESTALNQSVYWINLVSPTVSLMAALVILWAYRLRQPQDGAATIGADSEDPAAQELLRERQRTKGAP